MGPMDSCVQVERSELLGDSSPGESDLELAEDISHSKSSSSVCLEVYW